MTFFSDFVKNSTYTFSGLFKKKPTPVLQVSNSKKRHISDLASAILVRIKPTALENAPIVIRKIVDKLVNDLIARPKIINDKLDSIFRLFDKNQDMLIDITQKFIKASINYENPNDIVEQYLKSINENLIFLDHQYDVSDGRVDYEKLRIELRRSIDNIGRGLLSEIYGVLPLEKLKSFEEIVSKNNGKQFVFQDNQKIMFGGKEVIFVESDGETYKQFKDIHEIKRIFYRSYHSFSITTKDSTDVIQIDKFLSNESVITEADIESVLTNVVKDSIYQITKILEKLDIKLPDEQNKIEIKSDSFQIIRDTLDYMKTIDVLFLNLNVREFNDKKYIYWEPFDEGIPFHLPLKIIELNKLSSIISDAIRGCIDKEIKEEIQLADTFEKIIYVITKQLTIYLNTNEVSDDAQSINQVFKKVYQEASMFQDEQISDKSYLNPHLTILSQLSTKLYYHSIYACVKAKSIAIINKKITYLSNGCGFSKNSYPLLHYLFKCIGKTLGWIKDKLSAAKPFVMKFVVNHLYNNPLIHLGFVYLFIHGLTAIDFFYIGLGLLYIFNLVITHIDYYIGLRTENVFKSWNEKIITLLNPHDKKCDNPFHVYLFSIIKKLSDTISTTTDA